MPVCRGARTAVSRMSSVIELSEWASQAAFPDRPWLLMGKGPSFSRRHDFDLTRFNLFALNHVVREVKVQVAHAIDIDVIEDCSEVLEEQCEYLVLPRRPHEGKVPGADLEKYVRRIPVLQRLDRQDRLIWYSASTAPVRGVPTVQVRYLSSEAAIGILGILGAKKVRSLGVDGGVSYGKDFSDVEARTRLAGGQPSFDVQFEGIRKNAAAFDIDYKPLMEPKRIFVGADETQLAAAAVLEYSIKKHSQGPVEFNLMRDLDIPIPKDPANRPRTGFSLYRFMIPALTGFSGRALYLDADMQVFDDISELWHLPFEGKKVLCTYQDEAPERWKENDWFHPGRQMSVMMLDCSALDWDIHAIVKALDAGEFSYADLLFDLAVLDKTEIGENIPPEWNSLERYEAGVTKLLHYTIGPTQPWRNDDNPLRGIWEEGYREAITAGVFDPSIVERGVELGLYKPSLLRDLPRSPQRGRFMKRAKGKTLWAARRLKNRVLNLARR